MSQRQATKEQQQIIEATEGNIRVRAVPGSGKTFALTKRVHSPFRLWSRFQVYAGIRYQ